MPLITDPIDLLIDDTNDLVFVNGDLQFSRGVDAIVQQCRISLQMFQGEWFLDLDAGIPYWQSILGSKPAVALSAARIYMRRELELVPGVAKVLRMDVSYTGSSRTLTANWQVSTVFGDTASDEIALRIATGSE